MNFYSSGFIYLSNLSSAIIGALIVFYIQRKINKRDTKESHDREKFDEIAAKVYPLLAKHIKLISTDYICRIPIKDAQISSLKRYSPRKADGISKAWDDYKAIENKALTTEGYTVKTFTEKDELQKAAERLLEFLR